MEVTLDEVSPVAVAAPESVGETLRAARERAGLSLSEIAARTRIPLRHLEALEAGEYNGLPSRTYATGFVKAYARLVGIDEVAITRRVRGELAQAGPRAPEYQPYQAPDPARVPSRGLAIAALGLALAIIVLAGLYFGGVLTRSSGAAAPIAAAPDAPAAIPAPSAAATPGAPAATATGQVTLQTTDRVWLRVHDGDRTLYLGTMNPGEQFDVPADARKPLVDIGRPDKLKVTLNGSALPPLPASSKPLKDLRVGAAAVAARQQGGDAAFAQAAPPADGGPAAATGRAGPTASRRTAARGERSRRVLDETARANLEAARDTPRAGTP